MVQNPKFMRPEELRYLRGDSEPIRKILGWEPEYTFESMLDEMIEFWMEKMFKNSSYHGPTQLSLG